MIESSDQNRKELLLQKLINPATPLNEFLCNDFAVELFRANDLTVHS
jgi:hypothetical protein